MERTPYRYIRWVEMEGFNPSKFSVTMDTMIVEDEDSHPVLLFQNEWSINMVKERNETAVLKEISFRK